MNRFSLRLLPVLFLFALPASAQAPSWASASPMTITLSSYAFAPAQLNLQHGTVYRLHFVNSSSKGHNFSAPEFFAAAAIAPADKDKIDDGAVEVDSGKSADVELIPGTPGSYKVECTHFMHAMLGMTGTLVVR